MQPVKQVSGMLLAAGLLAVGGGARAQSQFGPNGGNGAAGQPPRPGYGTGGGFPTLPQLDPFSSTPQALLERDFLYMRATGGNVRLPPGSPLTPPTAVTGRYRYTPGTGGYGYYPGFPGQAYGYYYMAPSFFPQVPQYYYPGSVVQRDVVIIREPQNSGAPGSGAPSVPANADRREQPESRRPASERAGGDDFYLKGRTAAAETLSDALDDIRKAWLNGDYERLRSRISPGGQVGVYPKGEYRYSVPAADFAGMLKDAMARIDTLAFEFDRPKSEEAGGAFVTGKHTFLDADKKKQETFISYRLERVDGKWRITEAGSSSDPIAKHIR